MKSSIDIQGVPRRAKRFQQSFEGCCLSRLQPLVSLPLSLSVCLFRPFSCHFDRPSPSRSRLERPLQIRGLKGSLNSLLFMQLVELTLQLAGDALKEPEEQRFSSTLGRRQQSWNQDRQSPQSIGRESCGILWTWDIFWDVWSLAMPHIGPRSWEASQIFTRSYTRASHVAIMAKAGCRL